MDKVLALVGENNSGKSIILRALNAFFNYDDEKSSFLAGRHQYSNRANSRIELTFHNIPEKDIYSNKLSGTELIIRMTYSNKSKKRSFYYKQDNKYVQIEKGEHFIGNLKKDVDYVLIPIQRNIEKMIWSENSLVRKVLEIFLKDLTSKRDILSPKVREATHSIEKNGLSKVEKEIDKQYSLSKDFNFKLHFNENIDYTLLLNNIELEINEHGHMYNIAESGTGIQSLVIITLYLYLAKLKNNNIIIGIEEPESNLHPQAQREFIKKIQKLDENSPINAQIILTTHSTVIIDQLDHMDIVLFKKIIDETRGFKTTSCQLPSNFWEKYQIEDYKYYQFYHFRNSEFFYAKFIIIVESKNDAEVVKLLLAKKEIDLELSGISIFDLDGINNLTYPVHLLKDLGIPFYIILDKDFFIPYFNDKLEDSRLDNGFPKYLYEYKSSRLQLIQDLITDEKDRSKLLNLLKTNHSSALDLLEKYRIISMRFCLEMDLISSNVATKTFYHVLNLDMPSNIGDAKKFLLVSRRKQIKKIENIIGVLKGLEPRNLPNSYKRIQKNLAEIIKNLV